MQPGVVEAQLWKWLNGTLAKLSWIFRKKSLLVSQNINIMYKHVRNLSELRIAALLSGLRQG